MHGRTVIGFLTASLLAVVASASTPATDTFPAAGKPCNMPNAFLITGNSATNEPENFLLCNGIIWMSLRTQPPFGNIGIGTTVPSPPYRLTVQADLDGPPLALFGLINPKSGKAAYTEMAFVSDKQLYIMGTASANETVTGVASKFFLFDYLTHRYAWVVNPDTGFMGIATTQPQATLDVAGYMRLALNTKEPDACHAEKDGAIALTHGHTFCVCNPAHHGWVKALDGETACVW